MSGCISFAHYSRSADSKIYANLSRANYVPKFLSQLANMICNPVARISDQITFLIS